MTERDKDDDDVEARCAAGVSRVLARFDWRLLPPAELARRAASAMRAEGIGDAWAAAVNVYCRHLYDICRGSEGPDRQERAFLELQQYLFELSCREAESIPYDIRLEQVNEALLRIWERLGSYHKPGAFLAIAAMELRTVMRPWWTRNRERQGRPPWQQPPASIDSIPEPPDGGADPAEHAVAADLAIRVRVCFEETMRQFPRARSQLDAVWLKYVDGDDDATISQYLATTVAGVHVLRSRGLSRLRSHPAWRELAQELGVLGVAADS